MKREWTHHREVLRQARRISGMQVDAAEIDAAIAAVRLRLDAQQHSRPQGQRSRRILIMSGSIAAAMMLVVTLILSVMPQRVNAADALEQSAQATRDYPGLGTRDSHHGGIDRAAEDCA